ncbi:transglutaminase-like domain-containing protein [Thermosipho atlanticus]|uniref:Transglutaminase-like superfamily protein n=1 Tax=Thermosipho atlanticus DSM 15807 TaxID=1123380 RepID=A0A1M5TNF5_9BACT|nr:transglutaminase-like domain-containing protein [Thermosipho atlanticus]SHH52312.1 Transglutaminase-like superfamily protein [Thermosipho atlanticus DSM 15807]
MDFLTTPLPEDIRKLIWLGMFEQARNSIKERMKKPIPKEMKERLKFELFRLELLEKSYPYTKDEAVKLFKKLFKGVKKSDFENLLKNGYLDFRYINGEIKFQERFHYNIGFSLEEYSKKQKVDPERKKIRKLTNESVERLLNTKEPKKYFVKARVSIKRKKPLNEKVFVWLPFPLEKYQQNNVKLIKTSHDYKLASSKSLQRTVYMEGKDTDEFWIEFSYIVSEWIKEKFKFFKPLPTKKDLSEKSPHILFTPYLQKVLNKILKGTNKDNDYEIARKIYDFLTLNVRYSYVLPYALYDNIPEYVTTVFRGDCGFYASTFITLCRMAGIPAKWQSGWFVTPLGASPHDWALIYLKDSGWVPADLSFGSSRRNNEEMRQFYFTNLDGYRMFANLDFQASFSPKKKYFRNDPYDNQIGEMESEHSYIIDTESKIEILTFEEIK